MSKMIYLAALLSAGVSLPALAASNSASGSAPNQSAQTATQVQQDLRQDLTKAGFTDIHIAPGSFMIHAKDSRGNPTEMVVTPNSLTEVTALNPPSSGQTNTNGGGAAKH